MDLNLLPCPRSLKILRGTFTLPKQKPLAAIKVVRIHSAPDHPEGYALAISKTGIEIPFRPRRTHFPHPGLDFPDHHRNPGQGHRPERDHARLSPVLCDFRPRRAGRSKQRHRTQTRRLGLWRHRLAATDARGQSRRQASACGSQGREEQTSQLKKQTITKDGTVQAVPSLF
jgi:hypothetical protein